MSFRKIDPTFKLDVIKELWSVSNYSQISNKYGIPRATIYQWEQTAKKAIIDAFTLKTPGKRTINLKDENKRLKEQLRIMYHDKHNTAQDSKNKLVPDAACIVCEKCDNGHIKKNGTVFTKKYGFRQRYTCTVCAFSIYIDIKKTLPISK